MSPRRSSRARITQPSTALPQSQTNSSSASSRDRNSRTALTKDGRLLSNSPNPSSQDESDVHGVQESAVRSTRQSRRGQVTDLGYTIAERHGEADDDGEAEGDEEEVTRCVCRRAEYPGPPVPLKEMTPLDSESFADDAGSLFIQCDICKVWQHGGCVGIMDEAMCPDNYYCEQCRGDLHRVLTGAKSQRYSIYLPVVEPAQIKSGRRLSSTKRDMDLKALRDSDGKSSSSKHQQQQHHSSRHQRITNNSRAAYEEEQMLLKALEASKMNSGSSVSGSTSRNIKRSRDDSEDSSQDMKRRKTDSQTESMGLEGEGDVSDYKGIHVGSIKTIRGTAAQVQREREARDHEKERERVRAEAAGRRKGRAERRNAEGSEPPDEIVEASTLASKNDAKSIKSSGIKTAGPLVSAAAKKFVRPKRGRVGRNQYTRDRDADVGESPSAARDSDGTANEANIVLLPNGSKPARPRHINPNRTSMNELRKRAAGILEFISRTQIEIAGENSARIDDNTHNILPADLSKVAHQRLGLSAEGQCFQQDAGSTAVDGSRGTKDFMTQDASDPPNVDEASFKELSSLQMMDVLTREIVLWQKSHGKWGERA